MSAMEWPRVDGHTPYPWRIRWGRAYPYIKGANDHYVIDHGPARSGYVRKESDAGALLIAGPHLCDVPDCPGPRLVARLQAAEQMAEAIRARSPRMMIEALSAYESASEPAKERT